MHVPPWRRLKQYVSRLNCRVDTVSTLAGVLSTKQASKSVTWESTVLPPLGPRGDGMGPCPGLPLPGCRPHRAEPLWGLYSAFRSGHRPFHPSPKLVELLPFRCREYPDDRALKEKAGGRFRPAMAASRRAPLERSLFYRSRTSVSEEEALGVERGSFLVCTCAT